MLVMLPLAGGITPVTHPASKHARRRIGVVSAADFTPFIPKQVEKVRDLHARKMASRIQRLPVERLHCELTNAILRQIPDCGHIPHVEKPNDAAKLIMEFVKAESHVSARLMYSPLPKECDLVLNVHSPELASLLRTCFYLVFFASLSASTEMAEPKVYFSRLTTL